ncbi:MAG: (d)CMP kinase [Ottowia sp.]|nr:(d)CMP kinase [Ottowia sp.]
MIPVITIDGPTASGKGTVAQRVAAALHFHYLDSGALYRVVALASQRANILEQDGVALAALTDCLDIRFADGEVWLDGEAVGTMIRAEAIGNRASVIAVHAPLRQALLARQRAFRLPPGLVADGRDMGRVIFPDAHLKVFLVASVQARAERRYKQLIEKGISANIDALLQGLNERDKRDMARSEAPLKPAKDARVLDSSLLTIEQTVAQVLAWQRVAMSVF